MEEKERKQSQKQKEELRFFIVSFRFFVAGSSPARLLLAAEQLHTKK